MLKIHFGVDNAEKRNIIHKSIISVDDFVSVIVPEQSTFEREKEIIESSASKGIFKVNITSFTRILNKLSEEIFNKKNTLNSIGEKLLFRSILEEEKDELLVFASSINKDGLYDEFSDLFKVLRNEGVSVYDLEELIEYSESISLSNRLKDIIRVYKNYIDRIKDYEFDSEAKIALFERESHKFKLFLGNSIWILGYKIFSNNELRIIKKLFNDGRDLNIVLPFKKEDKLYKIVINKFKKVLGESTFEEIYYEGTNPQNEFARAIVTSREIDSDINLSLFTAKGIYEEAELIALDILKKYNEDPSNSISDFRIITSDINKYRFVFESTFKNFGLPLFCDERKRINSLPIVKSFMALLNIFTFGFSRVNVFSFLKSFVSEEERDVLDEFENYCVENGIYREKFRKKIKDSRLETIRAKYLDLIFKFNEELEKRSSAKYFEEFIIRIFQKIKFMERFEEESAFFNDINPEVASVLISAGEHILDLLNQLSIVISEEMDFKEYSSLLKKSISDISVGVLPRYSEYVELSSIHRSYHKKCKHIYICGMDSKSIPKEFEEDILLKNSQKKHLEQLGYLIPNEYEIIRELENNSIISAISFTENSVLFSYSLSDMAGDDFSKSVYFETAEKIAEKNTKNKKVISNGQDHDYMEDYYRLDERYLKKYIIDVFKNNKGAEIDNIDKEELECLLNSLLDKRKPIRINKLDTKIVGSSTLFELYKRCPFAYYVRYLLRAKKRKRYGVEVFDIGEIYHKTVEICIRDYVEEKFDRTELEIYYKKIMDEILNNEKYEKFLDTGSNKYLIKRAYSVLGFALNLLIDQIDSSDFKPEYFEEKFEIDKDAYKITGIIDRVDVNGNKFTVIDYKSGSKKCDINKIATGIDIQLMVYLDAFKEKNNDYVGAGFYYFHLNDPKAENKKDRLKKLKFEGYWLSDETSAIEFDNRIDKDLENSLLSIRMKKGNVFSKNNKVLSLAELDKLRKYVLDSIELSVDKIQSGEIDVAPINYNNELKACEICDYKSICRFINNDMGMKYTNIDRPKEVFDELE
ncbi:MAG: hypothetical protein CSB16_01590 [Clostridiales bacterium]|nr:MAG: hypothetical protein CSB16_01590 [Clostridiales bacterium]